MGSNLLWFGRYFHSGVLIPCSVFSISRASKASKHDSALEFAFYEFVFFIGFEFQLHISLVLK